MGDDAVSLREYIDSKIGGVHRRIEDLIRLQERADDAAKESLDYRLAANDHDRDLMRTELAALKRTVTLLVGGLTLAAVLAGIIVTVIVKYG